MKIKLISMLSVSAFALSAAADEGFKISGDFASSVFVESGKGGNSAFASAGAVGSGSENNGDFSVDLAEINLEKTVGNSGVVLGIGYGRMFDLINGAIDTNTSAPKATLNLTNAYFHHKVGDTGLSFKLGKFGSGVGYESYNYMNNMNYTRAYSFNSMNPWFFTGVAADYTINEMVAVGLVVANSTANTDIDDNESKYTGVNATIKPMEALSVKLNYLVGREGSVDNVNYLDTTRLNATVGYAINNMFDVAFHYSDLKKEDAAATAVLADSNATSMALYAGAKMETWGAGLRYEMVSDDDGLLFGAADNEVSVATVTGWYNVDQNAVLKAEIASTSADKQIFVDDSFAADDAMMTYGLGFLYRF
ncbi:MAG: outer membrane beta-barrel protein [Bdellovibrionaceae bacterium]|nr:outer membrane beta-barrel protein [Pseudobdellovibrionaceae bacterium]